MTINIFGLAPASVKKSLLKKVVCRVFDLVGRAKQGSAALIFVSEIKMRELNRQYRKKDRATDVLSFAAFDRVKSDRIKLRGGTKKVGRDRGSEKEWGDIIMAPSYIKRQAKSNGVTFKEELVRLTAHGALHLLGFDHATAKDQKKMFDWQERVVQKMSGRPSAK